MPVPFWLWSFILAGLGITGLIIARTRPRVGWWFNLAAQFAWTTYSIGTRQWGFLLSGVGYTYAYVRLLRQAYQDTPAPGVGAAAPEKVS